jgi:hypothetical protein
MISRLYSRGQKVCSSVEYTNGSCTQGSDLRGGYTRSPERLTPHDARQPPKSRTRKRHMTTEAHKFCPQTTVLPRHFMRVEQINRIHRIYSRNLRTFFLVWPMKNRGA